MCHLSHETIYEFNGHRLDIPMILCEDIPVSGGIMLPKDFSSAYSGEKETLEGS